MRSLLVNCPAVICTQHVCYLLWRDTTSELWTPVDSFTLIKTPTAIICSLLLPAFIIILHTIRLILCIQQAGEIDNLPVSLGQSILIVCVQVHVSDRVTAPLTPFRSSSNSYWI